MMKRLFGAGQSHSGRQGGRRSIREVAGGLDWGKVAIEALEQRMMPVVSVGQIAPMVIPGTGFDGVVSLGGCTGSLLSTGRHVLTAAHCFRFNTQSLSILGNPTGGTFTLSFQGAETGPIAYNATAAQIEAALGDLGTVNADKTTVTATGSRQFDIRIAASNNGNTVTPIHADPSGLTGGANPSIGLRIDKRTTGEGDAAETVPYVDDVAFNLVNNLTITIPANVVLDWTYTSTGGVTVGSDSTLYFPPEYVGRFNGIGDLGVDTSFDLVVLNLPDIAPFEANRYQIFTGDADIIDPDTEAPYAPNNLPLGTIVGYGQIGMSSSNERPMSGGFKHFGYSAVFAGSAGEGTDNVLLTEVGNNLGPTEAVLGSGDSGGPLFLNGDIAGVASKGDNTSSEWTRVAFFQTEIEDWLDRPMAVRLDMSHQAAGRDGVPDQITARVNGANLRILVNGRLATEVSLNRITSLTLRGSTDDDTFVVEGNPGVDITIVGGDGSDQLTLKGNGTDSAVYTPSRTTNGDGKIDIGANTLSFSGLEPITVSSLASFTLDVSPRSLIAVNSAGADRIRVGGSSGGIGFEAVTFYNIPNFTINTSGKDNVITVQTPLIAAGLKNFTIHRGGSSTPLKVGPNFLHPVGGSLGWVSNSRGVNMFVARNGGQVWRSVRPLLGIALPQAQAPMMRVGQWFTAGNQRLGRLGMAFRPAFRYGNR